MGTIYTRDIPSELDPADFERSIEHVRDTVRSVVAVDDVPDPFVEVRITVDRLDDKMTRITGRSDLDPQADYLRDGFDPDKDAYIDNPLHPDVSPIHTIGNPPEAK